MTVFDAFRNLELYKLDFMREKRKFHAQVNEAREKNDVEFFKDVQGKLRPLFLALEYFELGAMDLRIAANKERDEMSQHNIALANRECENVNQHYDECLCYFNWSSDQVQIQIKRLKSTQGV